MLMIPFVVVPVAVILYLLIAICVRKILKGNSGAKVVPFEKQYNTKRAS